MSGLSLVRQPDGIDGHVLVMVDDSPVGTVRKTPDGFTAGGSEAVFMSFQLAVVYVTVSAAMRHQREADRIRDVMLQALADGPVGMPK